jgi:hypothetical protein
MMSGSIDKVRASESYERVTNRDLLVYLVLSPIRSCAHQGRLGVSPRWGRAHRGRLSVLCGTPSGESDLRNLCKRFLVFMYEGGRASRLRSSPLTGLDP